MGKTSKRTPQTLSTIGNVLMGLSMVFALIIFFPIIKEEYTYRTTNVITQTATSEVFNIRIPTIGINSPVVENVDPWNQRLYVEALKNGVAHATGSAVPNQSGLMYLFAHSSDLPWRMTRYNTAFFRLGRVKEGDQIIVTYKGKDIVYRVREKKTVWPNEVKYLTEQKRNQLVLQTCTPIGTALKRLLVFAERVDNF
ncbi:MAG: hypothetical protein A2900_02775 [Candidatus Chisholmbacteria bacterium RIFCSPLOWO2_01_FULL_50_28]|uniref:Sortase n=1 Tax=Candidatus Chisholmbacteria bacterium RIFCSPHIGHO2_01_FULL_52_32 TaxID=1797591 RepID=A0A1G1VT94_9BACT|nr:MAG: hypothetical protein A2786_03970 [Candidatus Chisholmbacteria bacterium RIFCSPHIGHO2_01_FULL_52_32]OGY20001.1 MAG: hypothetical protein A2900_02775 [Candidatus Chisholmbacteria bacterium RIFCSPLOWO2_01_FULL_50_28]